ncbi:MAG: transcription elongation factor GreA [Chloroflexi bacterium]|nr:MAG: transcription elongation factor GreA [Chloroflexota bacterium]
MVSAVSCPGVTMTRMETPRNAARLTPITSRYDGTIAKSNDSGAQIPMTAVGFQALKAELAELRARRPALVEEVAAARSQGDLSENFAYHDARQHLGMLDGRIQTIEATLARAQVVEERDTKDVARIGSTVVVKDEFGESTYQLVGPTEGNMARGLISTASPLGGALLDRRAGDTVTFPSPGGERKATVVSIS